MIEKSINGEIKSFKEIQNHEFLREFWNDDEEIKIEITKVPSLLTTQKSLQFASFDKNLGGSFILNEPNMEGNMFEED